MSFMVPDIRETDYYKVDTTHGLEFVPADLVGRDAMRNDLLPYCEGDILSHDDAIEYVPRGYLARLSAPGYLDCTSWTAYESRDEAETALEELYD